MFKFWKGYFNRSSQGNVELVDESKIYAYHWSNMGGFWRAPRSCLHPLHKNQETDWRKCKKVKDLRQSNIAAYKRIKGQFPDSNFQYLHIYVQNTEKLPKKKKT